MVSWIRNYLLSTVYDNILQQRLLDEVDADSLNYLILYHDKPYLPSLSILFGGVAITSAGIYLGKTSYSLGGLAIVSIGGVMSYSIWRLGRIPTVLSSSLKSAKAMHQALKNREKVTFSLGINSSSAQRHLRLKAFLTLREFVLLLDKTTKRLVQRLPEEEKHLLSNFYTKEITQLINEEITADSLIISERGMSTLIDVCILHVSELCRLYVITLAKLSFSSCLELISIFHSFNRDLSSILKEYYDLSQPPASKQEKYPSPTKIQPIIGADLKPPEAVAIALEGISSSILSRSLTPEETQIALHRILQMEWLRNSENKENLGREDPEISLEGDDKVEIKPLNLTINQPPIDQVFEAFVEEKESQPASYDEDYSIEQRVINSSLMGELRMALTDRSKEFEQRERKALANFYGISEEELQKKKEEEKTKQIEEIKLEGQGEAAEEPAVWEPQRRAPLAAELLQALAKRGPVKEKLLGDSSDED